MGEKVIFTKLSGYTVRNIERIMGHAFGTTVRKCSGIVSSRVHLEDWETGASARGSPLYQ